MTIPCDIMQRKWSRNLKGLHILWSAVVIYISDMAYLLTWHKINTIKFHFHISSLVSRDENVSTFGYSIVYIRDIDNDARFCTTFSKATVDKQTNENGWILSLIWYLKDLLLIYRQAFSVIVFLLHAINTVMQYYIRATNVFVFVYIKCFCHPESVYHGSRVHCTLLLSRYCQWNYIEIETERTHWACYVVCSSW